MKFYLIKKPVFWGVSASFLLLALYFAIMSFAGSFSDALLQFREFWIWMLLLVAGFGVQVALYVYIKEALKQKRAKETTVSVAVSGWVSAGSMVACCLHHVTDVLPLLGLAVVSAFLSAYQFFFLILGILSNLVGVILMLETMQKHDLATGFMKTLLKYDVGRVKKITISFSLVLLALAFISTSGILGKKNQSTVSLKSGQENLLTLPAKSSTKDGITFDISPILDSRLEFQITMTTHSGSMDFDLTQVSMLKDDKGNTYYPVEWQGSPPGGHHRSGVLIFSKPVSLAKTIELTIEGGRGLEPRAFEWGLN